MTTPPFPSADDFFQAGDWRPEVLLIGASTGGPQSIHHVLSGLPQRFPLPILIVQHMSSGFTAGFASWLGDVTKRSVRLAVDGDKPQAGGVLIAPEKLHMEWRSDRRVHLLAGPTEHGVCPAVSRLFRSALATAGGQVAAVLLSGMGRDGAAELRLLREAGALTIAQDQATSAVHGMPGVAIGLGGAMQVLPDQEIGPALCRALGLA